ncbi:ABC-2 type transport system ATP-binding protein [Marinitoga hydrogenitolerans DSM 16785]|uniref:ABC-2 type transport system ATP-binding protein n=1 Tax=Marinitoga hydrogenitolerans (strain DSM 16785 / JCM 12826 / AT1271) TaxID=1122195 RepID=A0A1M4WCG1_MARH1|nr:ABC transporter ATP-binding protein [Marinitoga hydrogenitolerans]SHE78924.1 ABC-2 type transport system ATP-binding protein [Marinitoga hydrogenitolerans DSM 16785]
MNNVIEIKNLKKYYDNTRAVDGISFEVRKGEVFAFLGPNGAGKTTTLEIIEGLRKKDDGEVIYFGRYNSPSDFYIKERIGVQLQNSAFFDNLTVFETLNMFAGLYKKSYNVKKLIDMISLNEKRKAKVKELSGGQKQRLAIAVALVNDPEIIFLDEPTTGLDPQARRMIWEIIIELKKSGKTIVLTTHYMEEAEQLADRVHIIDHGKIIASGTVDDLIKSLKKETVIVFKTENQKLFEEKFKCIIIDNKVELETNNIEKDMLKLLEFSKINNINLEDILIRKPNLEDVFLNITGRSLRD